MVNPSWRSDLLQSLHWVGARPPEMAAMMQLPDGSEHEHVPGNQGGQFRSQQPPQTNTSNRCTNTVISVNAPINNQQTAASEFHLSPLPMQYL